MNFTNRPPSACTTSVTAASNSVSRSCNCAGVSAWVNAVKLDRSAKPIPHVTLADVSPMTPSK
ncbi:Uncharacterised protein [Mycobacterium tuberculosis]|nr:Uncharacterised protein [Mycobacterium tuberculosis]